MNNSTVPRSSTGPGLHKGKRKDSCGWGAQSKTCGTDREGQPCTQVSCEHTVRICQTTQTWWHWARCLHAFSCPISSFHSCTFLAFPGAPIDKHPRSFLFAMSWSLFLWGSFLKENNVIDYSLLLGIYQTGTTVLRCADCAAIRVTVVTALWPRALLCQWSSMIQGLETQEKIAQS